jgi:hypothetical protein
MTNQKAKTAFLAAAREWVCDSYAVVGTVHIYGQVYNLPAGATDFYSEMSNHDRWFSDLHLQVTGPRPDLSTAVDFTSVRNAERPTCNLPWSAGTAPNYLGHQREPTFCI